MLFYVNPTGGSKEAFLNREGTVIPAMIPLDQVPEKSRLVVLADSGTFTAAAVVCEATGWDRINRARDSRPKTYYTVPTAKLTGVVRDHLFPEIASARL